MVHFFATNYRGTLEDCYDADYATCKDSDKYITGYYILMREILVYWKSTIQSSISHSKVEAEYRVAATTYELMWLSYLCQDFQIAEFLPITH